jgi:hypothetical protein
MGFFVMPNVQNKLFVTFMLWDGFDVTEQWQLGEWETSMFQKWRRKEVRIFELRVQSLIR